MSWEFLEHVAVAKVVSVVVGLAALHVIRKLHLGRALGRLWRHG